MAMIATMPLAAMAQHKVLGAGVRTENFDLSVKPGEDFYRYACGRLDEEQFSACRLLSLR